MHRAGGVPQCNGPMEKTRPTEMDEDFYTPATTLRVTQTGATPATSSASWAGLSERSLATSAK